MEIVKYQHQMPVFTSKMMDRYFGGLRMGVFDIETMGLNPAKSELILAGFLSLSSDGSYQVTQYFAESKEDEEQVLKNMAGEFQNYDYLLTYNGKHFDIPFVEKRCSAWGLSPLGGGCYNLDLYLILHGHSNLKAVLKNLRQKTVEDYMGLHPDRRDLISGGESITLYENYLKASSPEEKKELREKILLHNHDDLLQLYRILPIILKTDFHRAMSYLGFPVAACGGWPQLNVSRIRIDHTGLTITGSYGGPAFSYLSYDDGASPYSCHFTEDGGFQFLVPTLRHKGSYFVNLRSLLPDAEEALTRYPAYVNGFLVLREGNDTNFMEANFLAQTLLTSFMKEKDCPLGEGFC